jgi:hypothetical protein
MPLGFERINERTTRPNELLNFIRPMTGPDEALSRDFLERIAAQAYPVMKLNYISVMALEEYPPNPEFAGRNFNAGEVIQLVLKSRNGRWLPFRHVQMVMMHELAHCKQMNHSRDFWRVRDAYAEEMRALWGRNYCGEGLWGNGRGLDGDYLRNEMPDASAMPSALCGGTYRGRRKRKAGGGAQPKPKQTYAERQQRRILKKFGSGGAAVGTDEATRKELENGKNAKGKPRVAGSARGRDLRAAAALARFEKAKAEPKPDLSLSDTESDISWSESEAEGDAATDLNGKKLHDLKGQDLVRVCGEEDQDDEEARREMKELILMNEASADDRKRLSSKIFGNGSSNHATPSGIGDSKRQPQVLPIQPSQAKQQIRRLDAKSNEFTGVVKLELLEKASPTPTSKSTSELEKQTTTALEKPKAAPNPPTPIAEIVESTPPTVTRSLVCTACSFLNPGGTTLCITCCNVLDPTTMWNHWRCESGMCKGGSYVNAGDYGRCQLCGAKKPA